MNYISIISLILLAFAATYSKAASCCNEVLYGIDPGDADTCYFNNARYGTDDFLENFCFCNRGPNRTTPSPSQCYGCCVDTVLAESGDALSIEHLTQFLSCEDGCENICRKDCQAEHSVCLGNCNGNDTACVSDCVDDKSVCNRACGLEREANIYNLI